MATRPIICPPVPANGWIFFKSNFGLEEDYANTTFFNLKDLSDIISKKKKDKKKIILCHGVFDLLHIGHIKHFQKAKKFGDFLFKL